MEGIRWRVRSKLRFVFISCGVELSRWSVCDKMVPSDVSPTSYLQWLGSHYVPVYGFAKTAAENLYLLLTKVYLVLIAGQLFLSNLCLLSPSFSIFSVQNCWGMYEENYLWTVVLASELGHELVSENLVLKTKLSAGIIEIAQKYTV